MMIQPIKLMIDGKRYIHIIPEPIGKDDCEVCACCDIDYVDEENGICIRFGYYSTSSACYTIAQSGKTQSLIDGKMKIDCDIKDGLGFECNQYFAGVKKQSDVIKYLFFSNDHKLIRPYYNGWLYNDNEGNVVFEITPFYPWHYETKKNCPEKVSYAKWIQNYKPTLSLIISKENLKMWIFQALELKKMLGLHED